MSDFDKLWDLIVSPPIWDGVIRGVRFSVEILRSRSLSLTGLLDEDSLAYLASVLNEIPEDVKSSKENIKLYLNYKKAFYPLMDKLL